MGGEGFGWRVRWARDQARLKQEALAGLAGISRPTLSRIESGRTGPGLAEAIALHDVLVQEVPGLSLEWLVTGRGEALAPARVDSDVKRRKFNRLLGAALLPSALSLPMVLDLERLAAHGALDATLVEGCERMTDAHGSLRLTLPPGELLPMVEAHLVTLHRRLAGAAGPPGLRCRLQSVTGLSAVLAGWTCYRLDRRRDARTYLDWAETLAREIDDRDTLVLALMARADLASAIPTGGLEGSPVVATRLLDEALAAASGPARAPLLLRRAEEHAVSGREPESRGDIDEAERMAASPGRPLGLNEPAPIEPYLANCLQMLGHPEQAMDALVLVSTSLPIQRAVRPIMLAACQAQMGSLDGAVDLLNRALDVIEEHGLTERARRVAGVRRSHLACWDAEPAVQRLDERLAAIL
jgi:transcriptional regulator with XRE-family HTH domain